jgi:ribosomal protein L16 Arg81 hydroxylase
MATISSNKRFSIDWQQPSYFPFKRFEHLETLIYPLSVKEFLGKYWKKKAVLIPGATSKKFEKLLSWEQLQNLLMECSDDHLRCFDNSAPMFGEKADLLEQWHQGQTLHIERIEKLVPALEEVCRQIAGELKASTKMYAFCSHPNHPGAHLHYDRFDVIVLQLQGHKKWQVQLTQTKEPYLECMLSPGDLLYIPRGHWHFAVASKEQSLHLTLGISFKNFNDGPLEPSILSTIRPKIKKKLAKLNLSALGLR